MHSLKTGPMFSRSRQIQLSYLSVVRSNVTNSLLLRELSVKKVC